ncbi:MULTISPECIES: FliM/FliN family flagellar motor switch protein [unclassified Sphingopyxis]|uniref:FliM/FliN family flagellar motor switch protein n=1 Tax=unclassified Sphingopyxis TaxID=2614943 RepID=UPI00285BF482|nr:MULTISPECIES: FliM/FliN family flagellar motor switch protein [unclassified Sphingopyxis]MDR6833486.1 flagellar motor switch protein FliM [Sphingopyxis sp. BE122]MDR7225755.1 flagellar motor switch protein FliM [Sphingopyxis sp. BE259]
MTVREKSVKAVKPPAAPTTEAADAKASLLLRKAEGSYAFPALDSVAVQFARSLRDLIRALGVPAIQVERAGSETIGFADWTASIAPAIFWRYHAPPLKGPVLLTAPRPLLLQLVDIFYGGKGGLAAEREELTDAEDRFAARLGRDMGLQLAAAWGDKLAIEPELDCVTGDPAKLAAVRADDELVVQRFVLRGAPFEGRTIACAYPLAALRGIAGAEPAPEMPGAANPVWAGALNKALRDVRLPVRSVLARPEISLVKLLALEVGDIIPLGMPRHVPVTVAGRSFAVGSIGEANGNAAIMIEHIEKGPNHD